MISIQNLMIMA